jgi:hypothetical protein
VVCEGWGGGRRWRAAATLELYHAWAATTSAMDELTAATPGVCLWVGSHTTCCNTGVHEWYGARR